MAAAKRQAPYVVLFVGCIALYGKSVGFEFLPTWDDDEFVLNNPLIRSITPDTLWGMFTNTVYTNYCPVQLFSYAIDHRLWGLNPAGYHLSNVLCHALNACLVFAVAARLTRDRPLALFAAVLFAVHPVNVENVAWVAQRKTLLATLFLLLSVLCWVRPAAADSRWASLGSAAFLVLAVFSKFPVGASLPVILLAYEAFLRPRDARRWRALLPMFAIVALSSVLTLRAQLGTAVRPEDLSFGVLFGTVYPTMTVVLWNYIRLVFLPLHLSGLYSVTLHGSFFEPTVLLAGAGWLAMLLLVAARGCVQTRFWFAWYWAGLLPVANILPTPVYYADRYLYLPLVGAAVLIAMAGRGLARALAAPVTLQRLYAPALVGVALPLCVLTYRRLDVWRDDLAFWSDTAVVSPDMDKAHLNLGAAFERREMLAEAEREYEVAYRMYPTPKLEMNLRIVRMKMRMREAPSTDGRNK